MFKTMGNDENRIPLSLRSKLGIWAWSTTCLGALCLGLLRPAARAVAAAAAAADEDFDAERPPEECLEIPPPEADSEDLR